MRKIALAFAAAATFGLAAPVAANATQTTATIVKPAHHAVVKTTVRDFSARRHCRWVVVKKHRGHRVIVTKVRRCW